MIGKGFTNRHLTDPEIEDICARSLEEIDPDGRKILVIIPDRTRTAPVPKFFRLLADLLQKRVSKLDFLVALGTHPPLTEEDLQALVGISATERATTFKDIGIFNHLWERPETFVTLGTIPADVTSELASSAVEDLDHDAGLIKDLPVTINRMILDYDLLVICGPTFPHEVVGFSGGNKYFFPGISGPEVINYSHWLGAVISCFKIIGKRSTPVREVINLAAAMIDRQKLCLSLVVDGQELAGMYAGTPESAFKAAAELSSQIHIKWLEKPVKRVLAVMPEMYDDIWTAAKGMYKLEPVVEEGGEVIIYAPHIDEISYTHGRILDEVGYHCCDFFLKQWEKYRDYPGGVLAHSTHVRGMGHFDSTTGTEYPRIDVSLATGIPEERCRRIGLGYRNPESIDLASWKDRGEDHLLVPKAGELLFRLNAQAD